MLEQVPPHIITTFRRDILKCIKRDIKALKEERKSGVRPDLSRSTFSSNQSSELPAKYSSSTAQSTSASAQYPSFSSQYPSVFEDNSWSSGRSSSPASSHFSRSHSGPGRLEKRGVARVADQVDDAESGYSDASDGLTESATSARTSESAASASTSGVSSSRSARADAPSER
ncbi:uncharacterized protein LOC108673041, partial [Hyalella azteca]|uniref:Uncharacterized protein LOC108673041 n=1 Tax=Hyalella azteca TaxID=294128 RepID=A0A8B7NRD3_HYAAZ